MIFFVYIKVTFGIITILVLIFIQKYQVDP